MGTVLSHNEREALSRFLAKVIEDVDKLAALFESRGTDATRTRVAQANLQATLADLRTDAATAAELQTYIPDNF